MSLDERLQQKIEEHREQPDIDRGVPSQDITFDEFKAWLKGFVQGKGYKLPTWEDWDVIMATVDNVSWFTTDDNFAGSVKMSELEQKEEITIGEFQIWLKALWIGARTIAKRLPGVEVWKDIKAMMNKVVEEEMPELKIEETTIQPIDENYLDEIEKMIDDFPLEDYYGKQWEEIEKEFDRWTQPYVPQPYAPQPYVPQPYVPQPYVPPVWVPTSPSTPIWSDSTTGGYVVPTVTTGTTPICTTGTVTVSDDVSGISANDFVTYNVDVNNNCNEIQLVVNDVNIANSGSTTFTVKDSALDGVDSQHRFV